ncbi:MAG: phosphotransferase [Alphaproteobacteria bacterium]|nr:phosphotransferase [Alphaproteobacteria bacterium]
MNLKFFENLKQIKGDASIRKFYRKKDKNKNSIIVFAKKEKIKNLLIYDAVNKILIKNKIYAPKLFSENYRKNFIEIEDFGNTTIYQILKSKKKNKFFFFKKIINLLNKIQSIKDKKIKSFNNKFYKVKVYEPKFLLTEAKLFCDWYVPKNLSRKRVFIFNRKLKKQLKFLISKIILKNDTFVHRDFHVSNMMYHNKKIGLIDSQDALIGNKAYDLASLIDDVRFKTSNNLKNKIYNYYLKTSNKVIHNKFKNDFEILSVLRNLKIIGIFTRLAQRDNKKSYLKFIPYAWKLINLRINKNKVFEELLKILKLDFSKEVNR